MEENSLVNKRRNWINMIGFIIFILGIYGTIRTVINLVVFEKYPFGGVYPSIPISFGSYQSNQPYYQTERDCKAPVYYYVENTSVPREPSQSEKDRDKEYQINCLETVKESRDASKINDISQSLLLLFIGTGILSYRKIFKI